MDLSVVILISGGAAIILGLLFTFFGYKLGRLLMPLCGLIVIEGLVYIFVYKQMQFDALGTWLLFGGSGAAVYIILFFIKRISGFFAGLSGSALFVLYIFDAFGLQNVPLAVPAALTVCIVSGLLTAVYQRHAVIVFTSLFGACVAAFAGIYIYIQGVDASGASAGLFATLGSFLSDNAVFIAGASAGIAVSGILIQSALTSSSCVLEGKTGDGDGPGEKSPAAETRRKREERPAGGANTGYFNIK